MSKRGENIYKRKDGRWEARYLKGYAADGRTIYGYVYGKTYMEAKTRRTQQLVNLQTLPARPSATVRSDLTFRRAADEWLESRKYGIKEATYVRYRWLLDKHLCPAFGDRQIAELESTHVYEFVFARQSTKDASGLAPKTMQDVLSVFRLIIRYAEEQNYLPQGQVKVKLPYGSMRKTEKKVIVIPPCERVILERHLLCGEADIRKFGIILALYTGIRIGELCALRWGDIDLKNGILYVNHTLQRLHDYTSDDPDAPRTKVVRDAPKTHASLRAIPLSSCLLDRLSLYAADAASEIYLLSGTNTPKEPRSYLYYYRKQLEACHLPAYTFHTLRHTFATRCVEEGFDIKSLSEILGHSNVKITMDRYVHPSMDMKRKHMERLEMQF